MADLKISALTSATTPLAGTEVLPIVQSGSTKKVATDDLTVKNVRSNATTGIVQIAGPAAAATRTMTVPDANFTVARTDAGNAFTGNQTISGTLTAGGTAVTGYQFRFTGSTSATFSTAAWGFVIDNTIAPPVGGYDANSVYIAGTITKPSGGGLNDATALLLAAPNIGGSGTCPRGTTLRIVGAPTGATTNRSFWVQAGASEFGADVTLTSANIIQGTAAKGVNFTANTPAAGMTSQLLNWYEEGTWTPNISDGTNNATTGVGTLGKYTRIGNTVHIWARIKLSSLGSVTGAVRLITLPFTAVNNNSNYAPVNFGLAAGLSITANQVITGEVLVGSTYAELNIWSAAGGTAALQATNLTNTSDLYLHCVYQAA